MKSSHWSLFHYVTKSLGSTRAKDLIFELNVLKEAIVNYDGLKDSFRNLTFASVKLSQVANYQGWDTDFRIRAYHDTF